MSTVSSKITKKNGNVELYYEYDFLSEHAPTLVLLHGFLSSSFSFRKLTPLLKKQYNVLAIDYPPFGKSGKPHTYTYSYDNLAKTLCAFLEEQSLGKVILVGHSLGGQLCLQMTRLQPNLVEKVVLLSGSSYLPAAKPALKRATYLPFFSLLVKRHLQKSGIDKNLNNVVFDKTLIDDEMRNGYMEPFMEQSIFRALGMMLRHHEGDLTKEELRLIETECLLIWGEHDKVVPLTVGKKLEHDLPNSKLFVIPSAAHLLPEEKPKEVCQLINHFVAQEANL
jgi:pimeloyl-ACP methyl ester carboxylesterase